MNQNPEDTFSLDIFEGPLAFLLHLIQKSEINIHDVPISEITRQYSERIQEWLSLSVDNGAEFISTTTLLLLMKSKKLLPKHDVFEEEEEDLDPNFEIIHQLLEYCHFKEAAKDLATREEKQSAFFNRGVHNLPEAKKQLGIEHLSMDDLAALFEKTLQRAGSQNKKITEEEWRVSDKINTLRASLKAGAKVSFSQFFSDKQSKPELIVNFLALLELMKTGECFVAKQELCDHIYTGTTSRIGNFPRSYPEFEPGKAGAEAVQPEKVGRCKRVSKAEVNDEEKKPILEVVPVYIYKGSYDGRDDDGNI